MHNKNRFKIPLKPTHGCCQPPSIKSLFLKSPAAAAAPDYDRTRARCPPRWSPATPRCCAIQCPRLGREGDGEVPPCGGVPAETPAPGPAQSRGSAVFAVLKVVAAAFTVRQTGDQ